MTWEKSREFLESDVVEWVEPIWSPNKRFSKKKKGNKPWGEQKVVGQIVSIEGEFIKFNVLRAAVIKNHIGSDLRPHKVGASITKKRATLLRADTTERLHWSEEDVRAALIAQPHSP